MTCADAADAKKITNTTKTADLPSRVTAHLLVLEVLPGAAGAGVRATARYRPMTDEERAEWRRRVHLAGRRVRLRRMNRPVAGKIRTLLACGDFTRLRRAATS